MRVHGPHVELGTHMHGLHDTDKAKMRELYLGKSPCEDNMSVSCCSYGDGARRQRACAHAAG